MDFFGLLDGHLFLLTILVLSIVWLWFYQKRCYEYWQRKGVAGPKPLFPFGNIHHRLFKRPKEFEFDWMNRYGLVYGLYYGLKPTLTIIDTDLIKQILIKDFHHFSNRRKLAVYDEYWNRTLFQEENFHWKRIRSILSPAFSSGKLKSMYRFMDKCVDHLEDYFDRILHDQMANQKEINIKKVFIGLTMDVTALTLFATQTNTNCDGEKDNPFVKHGLKFFQMSFIRVVCYWLFPLWLNKLLNITHTFEPVHYNFFLEVAKQLIRERKRVNAEDDTNIKRQDLIQLLIDSFAFEDELQQSNSYDHLTAKMDNEGSGNVDWESFKSSKKAYLSEKEIIAQSLLFFVAGFETTASTITYIIYELTMNEHCQQRLHKEMVQFHQKHHQLPLEEYYEQLMEHPFLDAVVKETLRKHPPFVRLERRVGSDGYRLNGIELDRDTIIEIPCLSVHLNEKYYSEPLKFQPERFMPENKHKLNSYAYMPFGLGPRNCIGLRFAYQELKLCVSRIVRKYRFLPTKNTPREIQYERAAMLNTVDQIPLIIERRYEKNDEKTTN